jgi:hypothetical protein
MYIFLNIIFYLNLKIDFRDVKADEQTDRQTEPSHYASNLYMLFG